MLLIELVNKLFKPLRVNFPKFTCSSYRSEKRFSLAMMLEIMVRNICDGTKQDKLFYHIFIIVHVTIA